MIDSEKRYRVLITGPQIATEAAQILEKRAFFRITPSYPSSEQIADMAAEDKIDALIVRQGKITQKVMTASPNLQVIVKHGVGVDNIDVEAATALGIPVCITPNANYQSVAEHALAMMFALAKSLPLHDRRIRNGVWDKVSDRGLELFEKCLGVIGVGRIGRRLVEMVQPLNMKVIGYDPWLAAEDFPANIQPVVDLDELLRDADFISLSCPRTQETTNMIGENEFSMMKPTAVLVNTARGGIINESALIQALQDGTIRGAGLDCFDMEPLPQDSPFMSIQDRIIMTPHLGGVTQEAVVRMGVEAARTLLDCLDGNTLARGVVLNEDVYNV